MTQRPTDRSSSRQTVLLILQLAISLTLFTVDILTGPGVADGVGYPIVLVLCLWSTKPGYAFAWSVVITILIVAGGLIVPDDNLLHAASFDRVLEVCTIWVIWFLVKAIAPTFSD